MADTGTPSRPASRAALRRYPALVWLVAAGLLALLLPSGLTLPQSGPSTLAEYAPVPGAGEGSSPLGELASAQSGGLGPGGRSGGGQGTAGAEDADEEPGSRTGRFVRKAGTKRCVGEPPRQTEDPMSPPCIAFFDGDNGGATAKGVTGDVVTVIMPSDGDKERGPNAGSMTSCDDPVSIDDTSHELLCKAYARYFNDRYQTYDRRVRLWATLAPDTTVEERLRPFAWLGNGKPEDKTVRVDVSGQPRAAYAKYAPYLIGYRPDLEDAAAIGASFVCSQLADRPARYSGTAGDRSKERVFGMVMRAGKHRDLLQAALSDTCGVEIKRTVENVSSNPTAAAQLQSAGVTTVLITAENNGDATVITRQATSIGWFPEWVVPGEPGTRGIDRNTAVRSVDQVQWANALALTFDIRRGSRVEQHWYRAYREGCPDCPELGPDMTTASRQYDALTLLFWGIQAAGPKLSAETIDKGLHALPAVKSSHPMRPAAYFAPGNYTFVKDATLMRWDPTGEPPGTSTRGCYRLIDEGVRYRAGEFPTSDERFAEGGPCQGETS